MRGKGGRTGSSGRYTGITPARAGKRPKSRKNGPNTWDHPRVCGEKKVMNLVLVRPLGSPPRVRGKGGILAGRVRPQGITPACAGKRQGRTRWGLSSRDHPRVCGEKEPVIELPPPSMGSPPHVRGKAERGGIMITEIRITLACARKSRARKAAAAVRRDHPRVCGEKFHPASDRKFGRVRGTKRSSGPAPAAAPAGLAGSCPASPPWSYPPRITVSRPRP